MAKHASALKAQRQNVKQRARNRKNLSQFKTQVKKLRSAVAAGDTQTAQAALGETISVIDRELRYVHRRARRHHLGNSIE